MSTNCSECIKEDDCAARQLGYYSCSYGERKKKNNTIARYLVALTVTTLIYGVAIKIDNTWWAFMLGIVAATLIDLIRGRYK